MILVLAHPEDLSAVRLHCALRSRLGPASVKIVSVEEIALAPRWTHYLEAGAARSRVRLTGDTSIDSEDLELVVQRVRYVPVPHFARAKPTDRDYAATEMHALLLSWLASLPCPVVNQPETGVVGLRERGLLEWMVLAARAGLATRSLRIATNARRLARTNGLAATPPGRRPVVELEPLAGECRRILVAGERVIGDLPPGMEAACIRLARSAGCRLLEVELGRAAGEWRFRGASTMPEIPSARTASAVADVLLGSHRCAAA